MNDQIIKLYSSQQEAITLLNQHIVGLAAAHQIVLELLLSQSAQQKQIVAQGLSQVLAHPERVENQYCLEILHSIQEAAQAPSRTSPEGRREWMCIVPKPDSD